MKMRLISAILVAMIVVLGLFFAATHGFLGLTLRNEARPFEIITFAVSLLIAFFLQRFVATQISDLRAEKNVLIEASTAIIRLLCELRERTDAQVQKDSISEEDKNAIVAGFRRVGNAIFDLDVCIGMSKLRSMAESTSRIKKDFYTLKVTATGGDFPTKGYSIKSGGAQVRLYRSLIMKCRRTIFEINSARG